MSTPGSFGGRLSTSFPAGAAAFPPPAIGNNTADDVGQGRLLPGIAVDQYASTLANWFGISAGNMPTALPNIGNYNASTWNLGFV